MGHAARELKFVATPEKGEVSALLIRPKEATHVLVLGHGASTSMRHANLETIAERMAEVGIATFRYNRTRLRLAMTFCSSLRGVQPKQSRPLEDAICFNFEKGST